MIAKLDKIVRAMDKVVLMAIVLIGCGMLGLAWVHIFYRYVLNHSLSWSEELLKIMLVWMGLLSVSMIASRRSHVSIIVFKQMFPLRAQRYLDLFVQVLTLLISGALCFVGAIMMRNAGVRRTPALSFPFRWMYAAVFVAFLIMTVYEVRNLLCDIVEKERRTGITDSSESE